MRTRIKFCGITEKEDAYFAAENGVDAIGMIFVPNTVRCISLATARDIIAILPAWVTSVAVVANLTQEEVQQIVDEIPIDLLQFQGNESPQFCQQFQKPYVKTLHVQPGINFDNFVQDYKTAKGLLLDTYHKNAVGGTGQTFDWNLVPNNIEKSMILAGGLKPDNVAEAIARIKPYGVDVASGIESSPGKKDKAKMLAFIKAVTQREANDEY